MTPREEVRTRFVWGWLRLLLGFLQMGLVAACLGALFTVWLHPITYAFLISATLFAIISRLIYRGRAAPPSAGNR